MDIFFIIISALLILAIFIPFLLFNKAGVDFVSSMTQKIDKEAKNNDLTIAQQEHWANNFIGLDTEKRKLLFMKFLETETHTIVVHLDNVIKCEVMQNMKDIKRSGKQESLLLKMDLKISIINSTKEHEVLNFFDINLVSKEDLELKRAKKWVSIINSFIHTNTPKLAA